MCYLVSIADCLVFSRQIRAVSILLFLPQSKFIQRNYFLMIAIKAALISWLIDQLINLKLTFCHFDN